MIWTLLATLISKWTIPIALIICVSLYIWGTSKYKFFADQDIPFAKPVPILGNFAPMMNKSKTLIEILQDFYHQHSNEGFFGMFSFRDPVVVVRDPDIIKRIAIKDFDYFVDHRNLFDDTESVFARSLVMLNGQEWRNMRATLSPAFTGSKMRQMFQLVVESAKNGVGILLDKTKSMPIEMEMKALFCRFTNDIIANCAFGISVNSLIDENNEFYTNGILFSKPSKLMILKTAFCMAVPKLFKLLRISLFPKEQSEFFRRIIAEAIENRKKNNIVRYDMIHLLMLARKGSLSGSEMVEKDDSFAVKLESKVDLGNTKITRWEDDDITAQCVLFFLGGFESTATLLSFAMQELIENLDVQHKLQQEIDEVHTELCDEPLTYEILQKMKYLDMVVSETLRKWPLGVSIERMCGKPYLLEGPNGRKLKLDKGISVWIPIYAIHRDPKYFPDPDNFDPERFNDENKGKIQPSTYLPFGLGPRSCIGSRFALMEIKALLFYLLSAFTFEPSPKTEIPIKLSRMAGNLQAENGFNMFLKSREKTC